MASSQPPFPGGAALSAADTMSTAPWTLPACTHRADSTSDRGIHRFGRVSIGILGHRLIAEDGFARIQVAALLERQFLIERRHRGVCIAGRVAQQSLQPVQGHHGIGRGLSGFHRRHRQAAVYIPFGLVQCIPRHEHGGCQPVRHR